MKAKKDLYTLTDNEIEIIQLGRDNADYITNYFFRPRGSDHGWVFDENFDPAGAWQRAVHHATQSRIIVVGGFGSGKTRGIGISACTWCLSTPDFAFMNAAPRAWQSELMYRFILQVARDTPFENLIYSYPQKPYPRIVLRFIVKGKVVESSMEFMSVEKNANSILGWEGDWINIDEAGLVDDLDSILSNLGSRMRGSINGRERLDRLSMITNSWDNPILWQRYDLAAAYPEDFLTITVSSRHNHNITPKQLELMVRDIPEDERERFIDGARPEGRGNYFSRSKVFACEDINYSSAIEAAVKDGIDGYELSKVHGAGVVYFRTPSMENHLYMLLGDPGTGNAPYRNAPSIQVYDVTRFPDYTASMVASWWGAGHGEITPFVNQLLRFVSIYNPIFAATDSTGTQKNTNQIINSYLVGQRSNRERTLEWTGVDLDNIKLVQIEGMDFSGSMKAAYLISARLLIESRLVVWPKFFTGMRSQLTNYDTAKDRSDATSKIPQDLVATFSMFAYAARQLFHVSLEDKSSKETDPDLIQMDPRLERSQRLAGVERALRGA